MNSAWLSWALGMGWLLIGATIEREITLMEATATLCTTAFIVASVILWELIDIKHALRRTKP